MNKQECIEWIEKHIPIAVAPKIQKKRVFIFPFSSAHAKKIVVKRLGEELYELLKQTR